jgi:hypothetical protein
LEKSFVFLLDIQRPQGKPAHNPERDRLFDNGGDIKSRIVNDDAAYPLDRVQDLRSLFAFRGSQQRADC